MQPFDLELFSSTWATFAHLTEYVRHGDGSGKSLDKAQAGDLASSLVDLAESFAAMGMPKGVIKATGRLIEELDGRADLDRIKTLYLDLTSRIRDEMDSENVFFIEEGDEKYYEGGFKLLGVAVATKFPAAGPDIDEAGKCFALNRYTACVFHLMRVLEHGLKGVADFIGHKDHRPNWEPVLKAVKRELDAPYGEFRFKGKKDFLENVLTHMESVKNAWRNRVMHVGDNHDRKSALAIFNATKGFMEYLAEGLPDKGVCE